VTNSIMAYIIAVLYCLTAQPHTSGSFSRLRVNEWDSLDLSSACAADLDGDGKPGLAYAVGSSFPFPNSVAIRGKNGDGTFATAVYYGRSGSSASICKADVDGNAMSETAAADVDDGKASVVKNNVDELLAFTVTYWRGRSACAAAWKQERPHWQAPQMFLHGPRAPAH